MGEVRIDLIASESQYADHLASVWLALPLEVRGAAYVRHAIAEIAVSNGITPVQTGQIPPSGNLTIVASYGDSELARQSGRPTVLLEHGAGQVYSGTEDVRDHPSYSGAPGYDHVRLFLCPSERVADRWRARYPLTTAAAIGVPKLDGLHRAGRVPPPSGPTTVAVSFHSDLALCAETRSALPHYERGLANVAARLRAEGIALVGHSHPRLWRRAKMAYERAGIKPIEDFGEVLTRASVFAADNTSALPEAASVGIPLVWLACPWYRTTHGGRFWTWPKGQIQCSEPEDLAAAIMLALEDPQSVREARERMVGEVYCAVDGKASERAVAAILTAADRLAF